MGGSGRGAAEALTEPGLTFTGGKKNNSIRAASVPGASCAARMEAQHPLGAPGMCALQPRQLFARAADASANELPAERVLRTPERAAGRLRLLPAPLPPAALVWRPAAPSPGRAPVWGRAVRAALGEGHGQHGAEAGQRSRALPWRAGRGSVLRRLAGWCLRGSGGLAH